MQRFSREEIAPLLGHTLPNMDEEISQAKSWGKDI